MTTAKEWLDIIERLELGIASVRMLHKDMKVLWPASVVLKKALATAWYALLKESLDVAKRGYADALLAARKDSDDDLL